MWIIFGNENKTQSCPSIGKEIKYSAHKLVFEDGAGKKVLSCTTPKVLSHERKEFQ